MAQQPQPHRPLDGTRSDRGAADSGQDPATPAGTFDFAPLDAYLARVLTGDESGQVERSVISGGLSQMTIRYRRTEGVTAAAGASRSGDLVVRVPPATGPLVPYEPVTEAKLMQAFAAFDVPVPRVELVEADPGPVGRPFYATSFIPAAMTAKGGERVGMADLELAERFLDVLMAINHAPLDAPTEAGTLREIVGHLPPKTPEGALNRWAGAMDAHGISTPTYQAFLQRWLQLRQPAPPERCTVVHGDFRLGNVLWTSSGHVAAMMDWEEAALGDPLYDLAWMLIGSYDDDDQVFGIATRRWFIDRYSERSGGPVDQSRLLWWEVATGWSLLCMNAVAVGLYAQCRFHDVRPMLYGYLNRRIAHVLLRKVRAYEDALRLRSALP